METKKFINYHTTEDFILDLEFVNWVLHSNKELDLFWETFIQKHPEKASLIKDAVFIIRSLQPIEQEIPKEKFDSLLQKIKGADKKPKFNRINALKYAASLSILITVGCLIYWSVYRETQFPIEASNSNEVIEKGRLILADGTTKEFDSEKTAIKQTQGGTLTINADTITIDPNQTTTQLNQVIIPYGERSEITLPDGTHIWLNSGSQLSYPSKFKAGSREVYLSGEAFFDVKANPDQPFYVITRDIRIKVLGTRFNVSAYVEDNTVETVLVKGKVTAGKNKLFAATIDLIPGERLKYDKSNTNLTKDKVDVQLYTSWVDGYLVFKNVPIVEIFKRLRRFYNQDISFEEGLDKITFSGKLDLRHNLKDVLDNIAYASSVKVQEDNRSFLIKK